MTRTPPHSPYSTPKVSVKFSLHPFLHVHSLFLKGEKNTFCVVKKKRWECVVKKVADFSGKMNRTSPKKCSGLLHGIYRLQVPIFLSQIRLDGIGETDNTKVRGTNPSGAGTDGYMGLLCCSRGGVCIVICRPASLNWYVWLLTREAHRRRELDISSSSSTVVVWANNKQAV